MLALLLPLASASMVARPSMARMASAASAPRASTALASADALFRSPSPEQRAELPTAAPSPALQPREVICYMMSALHRSSMDTPYARFGCEVALRFLAPSNPASRASAQSFASYLSQTW